MLRDRLAVAFCGINFAVMLAYGTIYTILPLAMAADGHGADQYGLVVAVNGLAIVLLQPLLTPWLLRMTPAANVGGGALLMALAMGIIAVSDALGGYVVAILVVTLGEIANATAGGGLIAEIAPPALRGRYAGAFGLTFGAAFFVTPLVGGVLLGDGSSPVPWVVAAGVAVASAAAMFALSGAVEARRAAAALAVA